MGKHNSINILSPTVDIKIVKKVLVIIESGVTPGVVASYTASVKGYFCSGSFSTVCCWPGGRSVFQNCLVGSGLQSEP